MGTTRLEDPIDGYALTLRVQDDDFSRAGEFDRHVGRGLVELDPDLTDLVQRNSAVHLPKHNLGERESSLLGAGGRSSGAGQSQAANGYWWSVGPDRWSRACRDRRAALLTHLLSP